MLKQLRREAVERLQTAQGAVGSNSAPASGRWQAEARRTPDRTPCATTLHLLVRTAEQLDAAIELRPASISLDYLDLYGLRPSIERVREAGIAVRVASPRVLKPGEEKIVDFLLGCDCPILVRSSGLLEPLRHRQPRHLTAHFTPTAPNLPPPDDLP